MVLITDFISYLREKGVSNNTIIAYTNDLNVFCQDLNIHPEDYVTSTDVRTWIGSMLNPTDIKPLSVATIDRRINS